MIFFLISGLLILLGAKNRAVGIIGSLLPLGMALAILFGPLNVPPNIISYISPFSSEALGVFPFNLVIGPTVHGASISLGDYLLLAGGILGFVGAILPRD